MYRLMPITGKRGLGRLCTADASMLFLARRRCGGRRQEGGLQAADAEAIPSNGNGQLGGIADSQQKSSSDKMAEPQLSKGVDFFLGLPLQQMKSEHIFSSVTLNKDLLLRLLFNVSCSAPPSLSATTVPLPSQQQTGSPHILPPLTHARRRKSSHTRNTREPRSHRHTTAKRCSCLRPRCQMLAI